MERTVISKHLKNIFGSGELEEISVCAKIAHTAKDGKNYNTKTESVCTIHKVVIIEIYKRLPWRETWPHLRRQKHL